MEEVKINYFGFTEDFDQQNNFLLNILAKNFKPVISDKPDFVFCSWFYRESRNKKKKFPFKNCIKIFFSQEPLRIRSLRYHYIAADRVFKTFQKDKFLLYNYCPPINSEQRKTLPDSLAKRKFCNFVYSNFSCGNNAQNRVDFCKKLAQYKHIDCPGKVLNNMKNSINARDGVDWVQGKMDFISNYKFTIAFENNIFRGYTTEKLYQPFLANSIPIYSGNPDVLEDYNPKAFINVADYKNFDEVIEKVIELDNNDELYMQMLREPVYCREIDYDKKLEEFLYHAVKQGNTFLNRLNKAIFI